MLCEVITGVTGTSEGGLSRLLFSTGNNHYGLNHGQTCNARWTQLGVCGKTEVGLGERLGSRASLRAPGPWAATSETADAALRGGWTSGSQALRCSAL